MGDFVEDGIFNWPSNTLDWLKGTEGVGLTIYSLIEDKVVWVDIKEFSFTTKRVWESIRKKNEKCKW